MRIADLDACVETPLGNDRHYISEDHDHKRHIYPPTEGVSVHISARFSEDKIRQVLYLNGAPQRRSLFHFPLIILSSVLVPEHWHAAPQISSLPKCGCPEKGNGYIRTMGVILWVGDQLGQLITIHGVLRATSPDEGRGTSHRLALQCSCQLFGPP